MKKISTLVIIGLFVSAIFLGYHDLEPEISANAEWLPEIRLSTNPELDYQVAPSIAVENGKVHVVWGDYSGGNTDIYYKYFDGTIWQPEQEISNDSGTGDQAFARIAVDNGKLHVVWMDFRDDDYDIYYRFYNGTDWEPVQEISTDIGTENQSYPAIAVENDKAHVVWMDYGDGDWDIYYRFYNGIGWEPEQEISTDIGSETQFDPSLAVENGKVHVVWEDNRDGDNDIYYRYYNGIDWQWEQVISTDNATERQMSPSIAVENGKVHVVWHEYENVMFDIDDIYYRYFDGNFWHEDVPIITNTSHSQFPKIAVENNDIYVTWQRMEVALGFYDIYYKHFNGVTWEQEIEIAGIPMVNNANAAIAVENAEVHIVWEDTRHGDWDVYYRRFVPPDFEITIDDIKFAPPGPVLCGTDVTINATIHNIGAGNGPEVIVRFYDGDPGYPIGSGPGIQIDVDQILFSIPSGENRTVQVHWTAGPPGIHNIYVVIDPIDVIAESNETNNIASKVLEIIAFLPPTLYIKAIGDDIILNWTPLPTTGLSHYLLYRSTSQIEFDFSNVWVNTSLHNDSGVIPLRTTWNDTGAAFDIAHQQYYYTIRTVFKLGEISSTSRTVGKWTKIFQKGVSTFSLPLEPLESMTIDNCLNDMNARYIKWMHPELYKWMKHGDGCVNDTQMKLGEGYEVKFDTQTNYTFTGLPGAMVSYDDDILFSGFDPDSEAKKLNVSVEVNGSVTLTWSEPLSMSVGDWYEVYFSNTRDGFFGTPGIHHNLTCPAINFGTNTTTITGLGASDPGARLYFIVVPFNANGIRGSSTYSISVWTEEYLQGYDTFGIPLKPDVNHTADWYCDNIPDCVGINYFNNSKERWYWHSTIMPEGAFDCTLKMTEGYQVSTSGSTKFTFIGV
ncbi:MAG: hypothetical protein JSW00_01420 [Thermoplasmata archaeon]|nr:MAG: hypothetical protein JSW00_01420 [Thermoplasmata archaeon]